MRLFLEHFCLPMPLHVAQIMGVQVCAPPLQAQPRAGSRAAAAAIRAPIPAVHDRSYASGLPRGGLHPIGAITARSGSRQGLGPEDFQVALAAQKLDRHCGSRQRDGRCQRILEPLTAPAEG
jgi:hypothetical protein